MLKGNHVLTQVNSDSVFESACGSDAFGREGSIAVKSVPGKSNVLKKCRIEKGTTFRPHIFSVVVLNFTFYMKRSYVTVLTRYFLYNALHTTLSTGHTGLTLTSKSIP